jgi:DNA-binding response OmpR family regulator
MKNLSAPDAILLLLDSDSVMRDALRDLFQSAGYLVVTAGDLGAAVDRLGEIKPDLLITRPYINSMPGEMAANYLRSKRPGLPVLIVGGFMDDDRVRVQNAIAEFHTFPKPFSREELLAELRDVLELVRGKS